MGSGQIPLTIEFQQDDRTVSCSHTVVACYHWQTVQVLLLLSKTWQCTRQCLNELQKEYCVKTKAIALEWQWVTLRSWCQMNHNGHSSPVRHKIEGKPHKILEKLKITSGKSTLFGHFLWSILGHLYSHLYFS